MNITEFVVDDFVRPNLIKLEGGFQWTAVMFQTSSKDVIGEHSHLILEWAKNFNERWYFLNAKIMLAEGNFTDRYVMTYDKVSRIRKEGS